MLSLIINNQPAVIKKGTKIKIVEENPFLLEESKTYSYDIILPVCQENIKIFGNIHRIDLDDRILRKKFSATIFYNGGVLIEGQLQINQTTEKEIKAQIKRNTLNIPESWANRYLDTIAMNIKLPSEKNYSGGFKEEEYAASYNYTLEHIDLLGDGDWLGWHNERRTYTISEKDGTHRNPYLLRLIRHILLVLGFTDVTFGNFATHTHNGVEAKLENTFIPMPSNARYMGEGLPHWTLKEFLQQCELYFCAKFIVTGEHSIYFGYPQEQATLLNSTPQNIEEILNTYKIEQGGAKKKVARNLKYAYNEGLTYFDAPNKEKVNFVMQYAPELLNTIGKGTFNAYGQQSFESDPQDLKIVPIVGTPFPLFHVDNTFEFNLVVGITHTLLPIAKDIDKPQVNKLYIEDYIKGNLNIPKESKGDIIQIAIEVPYSIPKKHIYEVRKDHLHLKRINFKEGEEGEVRLCLCKDTDNLMFDNPNNMFHPRNPINYIQNKTQLSIHKEVGGVAYHVSFLSKDHIQIERPFRFDNKTYLCERLEREFTTTNDTASIYSGIFYEIKKNRK